MLTHKLTLTRDYWIKSLIFSSIFLLSADMIYKSWFGITYLTRKNCILYKSLPRLAFLFYEYFVELFLLVTVGVFVAALLEKYFLRLNRFLPKTPMTAFVYASILPLCSCSAVPMIRALNEKIPFRTIITFVIAAPLLNPYIVMLSITVLGVKYALLRILCSFILAVSAGYIAEYFYNRLRLPEMSTPEKCMKAGDCVLVQQNIYQKTIIILKKVFPYIIVAGILGIVVEFFAPANFLKEYHLNNHVMGTLLVILIGVPVYFCNGADVLFLQPLVKFSNLPLGTALAFSLTSTSVCITSLVLLMRFIGKKMTAIILSAIIIMTFMLSYLINVIPIFSNY